MYYEAHITINPVFDAKLELAKQLGAKFGFKVANLLLKKREESTPERSEFDTFMTGHAPDTGAEEIYDRMVSCVNLLEENGFKVFRAKIEHVIFDTKVRHD